MKDQGNRIVLKIKSDNTEGGSLSFPLAKIQEQVEEVTPSVSPEKTAEPTTTPNEEEPKPTVSPTAEPTETPSEPGNTDDPEPSGTDEVNTVNPQPGEKTIELNKEEFVSCLQIIEKNGNDFVARKMKSIKPGKIRKVDDSVGKAGDENGKVRIHSPRSVMLCEDTNSKEGLILEAAPLEGQNNPNLYVITPDEGDVPGYRIQVGHIEKKKNEIKPEENVELVIKLPRKLGNWDEGTKLSFETTEEENWLLTLMNNSPTINESLREENVIFLLRINEDNDTPIPELKIGRGNGMTYTLKPMETESSNIDITDTGDSGQENGPSTGNAFKIDPEDRNPPAASNRPGARDSINSVLMEEDYSKTTIKIQTTKEVAAVQVKNQSTKETINLKSKDISSLNQDFPLFWNHPDGGPIFSKAGNYTVICKQKDGTELYRKEITIS